MQYLIYFKSKQVLKFRDDAYIVKNSIKDVQIFCDDNSFDYKLYILTPAKIVPTITIVPSEGD